MGALGVSAGSKRPVRSGGHATASPSSLQEAPDEGHDHRCGQHGPRHRHPRCRGRPRGRDRRPRPGRSSAARQKPSSSPRISAAPPPRSIPERRSAVRWSSLPSTTPASRMRSSSTPVSSWQGGRGHHEPREHRDLGRPGDGAGQLLSRGDTAVASGGSGGGEGVQHHLRRPPCRRRGRRPAARRAHRRRRRQCGAEGLAACLRWRPAPAGCRAAAPGAAA